MAAPHVCSDLSVEQHQVLWRMSHKAHRYGDQAGCWTGNFLRDLVNPTELELERVQFAVEDLLDRGILLRRSDPRGRSSFKLTQLCGCKEFPLVLSTVSRDMDEVPPGTSCGSAGVEAQSNHEVSSIRQVSKLDSICGTPEQTFDRHQNGGRGQGVREIRTVTGPRLTRKKSRHKLHRDEPMGLAWYFASSCRALLHRGDVSRVNLEALAASFKQWMVQDGVTPSEIRSWIDAFMRIRHKNKTAPPWRLFLYSYRRSEQKATKVSKQKERVDRRDDTAYWRGRP